MTQSVLSVLKCYHSVCHQHHLFSQKSSDLWLAFWQLQGIQLFLYLDDGLGIAPSAEIASTDSAIVRTTLGQAGFAEQEEKCQWVPTKSLTWLGFTIDLNNFTLFIPREKLVTTRASVISLLSQQYSTPKRLAQCAGKLVSLSLIAYRLSLLRTKSFYRDIESQRTKGGNKFWFNKFRYSSATRRDLMFWSFYLNVIKPRPITTYSIPQIFVLSDASATGGAAFLAQNNFSSHLDPTRSPPNFPDEILTKTTFRCQFCSSLSVVF